MPDKFGAAMVLVKSDIGGNITVRCSYIVFLILLANMGCINLQLYCWLDVLKYKEYVSISNYVSK